MMMLRVALAAGLLVIVESQASDVAGGSDPQGFLSKYLFSGADSSKNSLGHYNKFIAPNLKHTKDGNGLDALGFTSAREEPLLSTKEEDKAVQKLFAINGNTSSLYAIGVGLLSLVTMLGVRIRRGLQPVPVLASSSAQGFDMPVNMAAALSDLEMKSQGLSDLERESAAFDTSHQPENNFSRAGSGQLSPPPAQASTNALEVTTGEEDKRSIRWTASAVEAAPCDERMSHFLRQMDPEILVRLDDSVETVMRLGGDRYLAEISPLKFFGLLTCRPVATLRVEKTDTGVRYVTEKCTMEFTGPFRRLVSGLRNIGTETCTDLSAHDGVLSVTGDFALTVNLPRWWPIPDSAMSRGESIIQGIVEKDTRLTVERLGREYDAWHYSASGSSEQKKCTVLNHNHVRRHRCPTWIRPH
jgi:hypothetical protein